jgi:hypothetical protein
MSEINNLEPGASGTTVVPLSVGGQTVYIIARELGLGRGGSRDEQEISERQPRLEKLLGGIAQFAKEIVGTLQETDASKVTVEFGCEFALESGSFIAMIGKASSKSALRVGLEWTKPIP